MSSLSSQTLVEQECSQYSLRLSCSAKPLRFPDTIPNSARCTIVLPTPTDAGTMSGDDVPLFNLDVSLGLALVVTYPADIARHLRSSVPRGSDYDIPAGCLISELESKMTAEYVRLAEQTKLLEGDLESNLIKTKARIAAYILEKQSGDLLPYEIDVELEAQLRVAASTQPLGSFSWFGDYPKYPESYSGISDNFKAEMDTLLNKLGQFSPKNELSDGKVFDFYIHAMRKAVNHCGNRSDVQARLAVLINQELASYLPEIESLLKTIRTRKFAELDQLKAHGVISIMEDHVFDRLDGYQNKLKEQQELMQSLGTPATDSMSRRALKWRAAMCACAGLSQTFISVFQRFPVAFGPMTSDIVQAQIDAIPEVAAITFQTMVDYAAEIGNLRDNHSLKTCSGRPAKDYLLIEFPVIGLEGRNLLIGLCEFLNIHYAIEYGFEIVD